VCSSDFREEIDKLALGNHSYSYIEKWCNDRGFKVTHMSIRRHCTAHIEGFKESAQITHIKSNAEDILRDNPDIRPMVNSEVNPLIIDRSQLLKSLGCSENKDDLANVSKLFLTELVVNQLSIVLAKQQAYMNGLTKYPADEIRGLQTMIGIFESITCKTKNNFRSKNFFDLEGPLNYEKKSVKSNWEETLKDWE